MTIDEAYADITKHIEDPGHYSHNIVTWTLRQLAAEHGVYVANKMVDDLDLYDAFGIGQVSHEN